MVRIGSRKWTPAHIGRLMLLVDSGSSAASAAIALKRSISVVQNKARSLGKPFPIVASGRRLAAEACDR
jgi:gamma-glutamyltranspeptidase